MYVLNKYTFFTLNDAYMTVCVLLDIHEDDMIKIMYNDIPVISISSP